MSAIRPSLTGRCRFSPPLDAGGGRVRRDGATTDWWMILECDPEVGRYLRHLHHLERRSGPRLSVPLWGTHISVIQDEPPLRMSEWKICEGAAIAFEMLYPPQEAGAYVFFPVRCEPMLDYRERLGLPREPRYPLHLTIGNFKP